jgi:broad specificity phosphatase PhoE
MPKPSGAYPMARCKVIHLVRHGQATHNTARVDFPEANVYESEDYFDAPLTDLGWKQAQFVHEHIASTTSSIKPQLVVASPLSRCIQTAIGVFGSGNSLRPSESKFDAFMLDNVAGTRPGISAAGCPRFAAVEYCRECTGLHPCDRRRSVSELAGQYPAIDFSDIVSDADVHWRAGQREGEQEVQYRAAAFATWLCNQPEQRIAVVSHSGFLWEFTRLFGEDLTSKVRGELQDGYANCELRSLVLVDKQGIGQPFGRTDFPGCSEKYFPGQ